ncbi:MAG: hypothetical protein IT170_03280, partial [Bryobacterales bacterium]|nr:hypothetical protein [Bryobacterales bacterium]
MTTKTFHSASVQDAIRQARRELGGDAMLLNSKRIPSQAKGQSDRFAVTFAYAANGDAGLHSAPQEGSAGAREAVAGTPYDLAHRVHQRPEAQAARQSADRTRSASNGNPIENRAISSPAANSSGTARNEDRIPSSPGLRVEGVALLSVEEKSTVMDRQQSPSGLAIARNPEEDTPEASLLDAAAAESLEKLREQMLSMRKEMLQLAGSVRRVSSASYRQELPSDSLRHLYDLLVEQDFHPELIERILSAVSGTLDAGQRESSAGGRASGAGQGRSSRTSRKRNPSDSKMAGEGSTRILPALQEAIASHIDLMPEPGLRRKRTSPLVISLVGPPGAGKTTTLVKLAVRYSEISRFPLQIISMDNFRVGASEQLRAYAAVLGVGFDTLTTVRALEKAIHEYSSKEIILVDTPGLGWRDFDAADDLASFLRSLSHTITHMVAPASMKPADFERLADLYEAFDYQSLIYTKLDETTSIGQLVSESWRRQKPLAYFATGQRIPDDLELASRERICERILP